MKIIRNITVILLYIYFSCNLNAKNTFNKSKLDDFLHKLEKNNKAMCGVVITKDEKPVYENYIGFSSVENKIRNNNLTRFRIGSITKIFTAVIIFQLIEEEKLSLDAKLSGFYSKIPNSDDITIEQMLEHRSGIHNLTADPEYFKYMTYKKSKNEILKIIEGYKPDFRPGEKFEYSNSNYVLLGYIIEDITNSTYAKQLETRITAKLNLKNTTYGRKIDNQKNDANSYKCMGEKWIKEPETDMSIPHGAGAIVSSTDDLVVFISALFDHKLISVKSLNEMKKIKGVYGKGLGIFRFREKIAYGHNGEIDGFVSNLAFFPAENLAVTILANGMNYNFNNIGIGILSIYFNVPYNIPDLTLKPIELSIEELKMYEGEYSSKQLPLKITLKIQDKQLHGKATGQSAFPLTPFSKTEFRFDPAGIVILFAKDSTDIILYNLFVLNQGGKFTYEKK